MINRGHQFAKLSFHLLPHTITISYRSVTKTQLNHNNITSLLSRREISNYSDSPAATATTTMERSNCSPITIHRVVRPLNCFRENLQPPRPSALTGPRLESDLSNRFYIITAILRVRWCRARQSGNFSIPPSENPSLSVCGYFFFLIFELAQHRT